MGVLVYIVFESSSIEGKYGGYIAYIVFESRS